MFRYLPIMFCLVLALALVQRPAHAQDELRQIESAEQLLVLKNGRFLQGLIERDSAGYVVRTRAGSRLRVPAEQALLVCETLEDAYWGKLSWLKATDAEGQASLFRWCLQHQLWGQAANQMSVLRSLNLPPDKIAYLERQQVVAIDAALKLAVRENQSRLADDKRQLASNSLGTVLPRPAENKIANESFFATVNPVFTPLPSLMDAVAASEDNALGLDPFKHSDETRALTGWQPIPLEPDSGSFPQSASNIRQVGYTELADAIPPAYGTESQTDFATIDRPDNRFGHRPRSLPVPKRLSPHESTGAAPLATVAPPTSNRAKTNQTSMLSPMESTIGAIPALNSQPKTFVPRDEFDPEIFNRQ